MSPFGIENLPGEALRALRTLPFIADRLDAVAEHTAVLPQVDDGVAALTRETADMNARVASIEEAMPTLIEVQQHLAALPETMQELQAGIPGLTELLTRLVGSMEELDSHVGALQGSIEPVGRLADRLPGGSRRS